MSAEPRTLIDDLLAEQQRLTAVERFARKHESGAVPAHARTYRDLIPHTRPAAGQQLAFAVDLDACTGCKACVSACHSLNGLDEHETWRTTGLLVGHGSEPYQQTITTACHHCVEPACLDGCPVMAYEKDAETGIVRHLDDQCIGCQYCVLKCPYDVPKYSERLGIVRKCDMCIDRLAAGEAPACVQACPTSAIRIEVVAKHAIVSGAVSGARMIPGAFESGYTKPATTYRTTRGIPACARPADALLPRREPAHWPLIAMLVLTQLGAGAFCASAFTSRKGLGILGWAALHAGLIASAFHLGRPRGAWRFFLGLRTSWMSREILAFAVVSALASASAFTTLVPMSATALASLGAVFTSAMIYVDTRRSEWRAECTFARFFGAALLFAIASGAGAFVLALAFAAVGWERHAFFTRATALRMPGGVPA